jgi:hypothetical protein
MSQCPTVLAKALRRLDFFLGHWDIGTVRECPEGCPSVSVVGDGQALELLAVGAPVEHEVVRPHMVGARRRVRTWAAGRDALSWALAWHLTN